MRDKLKGMGFPVAYFENLQTRQVGAALREFRNLIGPGSVALFFYAGHGLQVRGDNFLPTVDAELSSEEDVPNQPTTPRPPATRAHTSGDCTRRVVRGGSWASSQATIRSAARLSQPASYRAADLGLRLARTPKE